jgi:RNA polymerase sigma-70 factor (ECF subfamily)
MIAIFHGVKAMQEDAVLVKQTLSGDEQSFHCLIMKYYTAIYAIITSWVKSPEDAKDLTQEVFLETYKDLDSLRHPEQFRLWLRQIARHQCQDWLRKRHELFDQLDDDMIYETPSADELLILQETLAKVMKAIDELPRSESQLLRERYLDDVSYDEMEARHGLSHSVLAMRLLRARQHVREKIKLLSGALILSWHDAVKKMLVGGIETMKITAKVKIAAIGVAAVLVLGGTGVIIWHTRQSAQETQNSAISQTGQQINSSLSKKSSIVKAVANKKANKPIDKQKEDVNESQNIAQTDSLKDPTGQETKKSESKIKGTVDPKEKSMTSGLTSAERAEIEAKFPVLEGEIKTEMIRINSIGNKIQEYIQSGQDRTDDSIDKWCAEADKEVQKAWTDLFNTKIGLYTSYGIMLEGKNFKYPLSKGGSLYELAQLLPFNVFPRNFDDNNFKIIDNNQ